MHTWTWRNRMMFIVAGLTAIGAAKVASGRPVVNVITFTRGASGGTTSSPAQTVEPPGGSFAFGNDQCDNLGNAQYANSSGDAVSATCHFASASAHADQQVSANCAPGGSLFACQVTGHGGASANSYGPDTSVSASATTGANAELVLELTVPGHLAYYITASVLDREIIGPMGGSGSGSVSSSVTITGPQGVIDAISLGATSDNYPGVGEVRQGDVCAPAGIYHVVLAVHYTGQASASGGICSSGPSGVWQGTMAGSLSLNFITPAPRTCMTCAADVTGNNVVNIDDLVAVITHWGATGGLADINHDNAVNIDDLVAVITSWGPCPN